jgi:L-alanine-DL-glutamate epimerase-like enolase superfamily enzyme
MQVKFQSFTIRKKVPLTISRGTTAETTNVWLQISQDGIEGWGEAVPFSIGAYSQTTAKIGEELHRVAPELEKFHPSERQKVAQLLAEAALSSATRNAIDLALHDWMGKLANLPLWKLWGYDRDRIVPISGTIGISSPEVAKSRVGDWQKITGAGILKLKLGNPAGTDADKAMVLAVREVAPQALLSVDANGGWSLAEAIAMGEWLAEVGQVKYIEQPLAAGQEADLEKLFSRSPLPIFVDESCFHSSDIPKLADRVHGINIKLMKCGGLTEALRMVNTAQALGLQIMFGCYSDSSLTNTAAAQISASADYLDLDSHLNLANDPFTGALLKDGRLLPNNLPGLGVTLREGIGEFQQFPVILN